jgi:hypothetical protein
VATEQTPDRRSRRMLLIGAGLVAALAIGAIALLVQNDEGSVRSSQPGTTPSGGSLTPPGIPRFRFEKSTPALVRTSRERIDRRHRRASVRAAAAVRSILTDLYTEAFLDPANWEQGEYRTAFREFAGGARKQAEAHAALLTAGPRAGERYDSILPGSSRIATRILLDRTGVPTLAVSIVRFSAAAHGTASFRLRSNGQFFFERIDGSWKVVSFHVTRSDRPRAGT